MNTTTSRRPAELPAVTIGRAGWWTRLSAFDGVFALLVIAGAGYAFHRYGAVMDVYESWILAGCVPALIALGWFWGPIRPLSLGVGAAALLAIGLYARTSDGFGADLAAAEQVFLLKYFLSSQSAILWMSLLFFLSTVFYWIGVFVPRGPAGDNTAQRLGSGFAWAAVVMALIGSLVRWYESHQIAPDIGHIPVSNLYEVFVLFCWMTTLFYLYYEQVYRTKALGAFAMLIVSAAVGFLLWYTVVREAHEIQPLVPALQSWWMKLHVPTNFVGYGTFAIAAMVAFAYLIKLQADERRWWKLAPLWGLGVVLCFEPMLFRKAPDGGISDYWAIYFGVSALLVGGIIALRRRIAAGLPSFEVLDDVMYKAIAVGFAFFTIATILGAFWAAEAWGGYWSWDPKETWALIVWLNYAAWLHMRLMKGLRGAVSAWWALVGLAVTTFAFLGVNMFLSGLHSYGEL
ncbi:MAG: c-type cytochrome biogenesis protein CcsB [Rubrivivax sp.]|jgi:cytochrome c-type biogenesis protein CcsB|nr:c-type cytochrome biogenesis protein CcsB [Rubrivivax sp.]